MELTDNLTVKQIIGGLMKNTLFLLEYTDIVPEDFEKEMPRICFGAIRNLYKLGASTLTVIEVENEILKIESNSAFKYKTERGLEYLKVCYEIAEPNNFKLYYNRLKKLSLLRCLKIARYDISEYYKDEKEINNPLEEIQLQEKFDESSIDDILNSIEGKYNEIKNKFVNGGQTKGDVAEGIANLVESLKQTPDNGPLLEGDIFSYVTRGARAGKLYLRSASSSVGKTRTAVFDACRLVYPIRYNQEKGTFIKEVDEEWKVKKPRKVLFIVTEMDKEELQTIILAYLSGVNEEHILRNRYDLGEEERVNFAIAIMEKYKGYFIVEEISEPNLVNVESTIKKYATIDKIKYYFYDYIHTTSSLMSQFSKTGLREDVVLMLLANQLKQLAKDYNVFIFSATQVNATGMVDDGEFKDINSIRGAKSIADKIDCGYIMTKISPKMWDTIVGDFRKYAREGNIDADMIEREDCRPTHILDVYKNRRGRLKDIRIWTTLDLGNGYRKDRFITNAANYPISNAISEDTLFTTQVQMLGDWREMLKKGEIDV